MKDKKRKAAQKGFQVLPGEGKRFSLKNFKQAAIFYVLLLLALVVIVQIGYHWLGEQFLVWRLQLVEAEMGEMRQEITVDGVITRHEKVIYAPANAVVLYLAPDGERISTGEELARLGLVSAADLQALNGSEENERDEDLWRQLEEYWDNLFSSADDQVEESLDTDYAEEQTDQSLKTGLHEDIMILYNEEPGLISYYTDGLETLNGPYFPEISATDSGNKDTEDKDIEDKETGLINSGRQVSEGNLIGAGDPLLKIVDNWQWYFSATVPLHPGRTLAEMQSVTLEFKFAEGETVRAALIHSEIDEAAQKVRLAYKIEKQLPGFEKVRLAGASLLYRQQSGIIVPEDSVFEKDGEMGLYINQGGRVVFRPVSVIERQNEMVMIEGLEPFSLVITRPALVEEGQRFR